MELCKICGDLVGILTKTHCEKHGLTIDEYRAEFGKHPVYIPLTTKKTSEIELYECDRKYSSRRAR